MLGSYRQAQTECAKHENDSHTYQTELSSARLEIVSKEGEVRRLEERQREMERDIKEVTAALITHNLVLDRSHSFFGSLKLYSPRNLPSNEYPPFWKRGDIVDEILFFLVFFFSNRTKS